MPLFRLGSEWGEGGGLVLYLDSGRQRDGRGMRFLCSGLIAERIGEIFPWGTLAVNVAGSWIIGFVFTLTEPDGRILVGTTRDNS